MNGVQRILDLKLKPKETQMRLVHAVVSGRIPASEFISFFKSADDAGKGVCADAMKHVSAAKPGLLEPYFDILAEHVNYPAPRVKWGVPEAIGNMAAEFPEKMTKAVPLLMKNAECNAENSTVIRWCAAFALCEIAKHNRKERKRLLPLFERIRAKEKNSGVRNVYVKALKAMEKESQKE